MGTLWTLQSSHPGLSLYSAQPLAYGTAYYAISLGTNVVLTILIVARLILYRRTHLAHLPPEHAQQYLSLAALIVESAALYTVFAVAFLVSYALNKPINQIWLGFAQAAQVKSAFPIPQLGIRRSLTRDSHLIASRDVPHHLPRRGRHGVDEEDDGLCDAHVDELPQDDGWGEHARR